MTSVRPMVGTHDVATWREVVGWMTMSVVAVGLAGCGASDDRLVVFAASSLTDAFDRIEVEFEAANPDVDVVVNYGGSSSLVAQLAAGAPADVVATANPEQMQRAVAGRSLEPVVFARNSMVIAVEAGNPLGIDGLSALEDGPVVVLAAPEVPAGAYARQVLDCAGVDVAAASLEPSVRSVATKVALGEADAGLVYRTDIDDGLDAVSVDAGCDVSAEYPIVALGDSPVAARFVSYVVGSDGAAAMTAANFEVP